ncbi:MAG: hypothetical protein H0U98_13730 [Alphaproteobacteria bacterium]|nr:hypothetical protein [Alphaproteobacteria bacterium]
MKTTLIAAAAAAAFAFAVPASAQMADQTSKTGAKTGTTMQTENSKPMASGSMANGNMAMSGDMGMKKPMKKTKKTSMMADKPMTEDQMKSDSMKH